MNSYSSSSSGSTTACSIKILLDPLPMEHLPYTPMGITINFVFDHRYRLADGNYFRSRSD